MDEPEEADRSIEPRIGDADRDAVVARLSQAMAEGRLDPDEFGERSRAAYSAKVPSDLARLTGDLPPMNLPAPVGSPPPAPVPASGGRQWIVSLIGDRRRRGAWNPGSRTVAVCAIGDLELDLTETPLADVEISAFCLIGDLRITVPPTAAVSFRGGALIGEIDDAVAAPRGVPTHHVSIRGFGLIGDIKVRRAE